MSSRAGRAQARAQRAPPNPPIAEPANINPIAVNQENLNKF